MMLNRCRQIVFYPVSYSELEAPENMRFSVSLVALIFLQAAMGWPVSQGISED